MGVDPSHVGSYLGEYQLKKVLGEGRLGSVYLARHGDPEIALSQGGDVALRVMRPELCDRHDFRRAFEDAVVSVGQLDHPSIIRHLDALELPDGQLCLVEEAVEGVPLSSLVGEGRPMPWSRALTIVQPLLGGLAHAAARGVVHGALRPENIVIRTGDEQVMLSDFGIAASELGPTLEYMAPELLPDGAAARLLSVRPARPADERSDVYSIGMVLYVAVTGGFPWGTNKPPRDIIEAKRTGEFPRADVLNPAIPPSLGAVIEGALLLDPDARIGSATELSRALTEAAEPAIGTWVRPGRVITKEKQFVAQRLEEAIARRADPHSTRTSSRSLRAVEATPGSNSSLDAIHTGHADPLEVARVAHAREAWARRSNRGTARFWSFIIALLSGPVVIAALAGAMALGMPIPVPQDLVAFVLPAIAFFLLGGWLGLKAGLRERHNLDLGIFPRALISPVVSVLVLFGGDWLLNVTDLGGDPDSAPRAAVLLAAVWSANAVFGWYTGERLNVKVERLQVDRRIERLTNRHRAV